MIVHISDPVKAGPVKNLAVHYNATFPDLARTLTGPLVYRVWTTGLLKSSVVKCSTNKHINLVTTLTFRRNWEAQRP
jgi:hypothetical protein